MRPKRKASAAASTDQENDEAAAKKKRGRSKAVAPPAPSESKHEGAASPSASPGPVPERTSRRKSKGVAEKPAAKTKPAPKKKPAAKEEGAATAKTASKVKAPTKKKTAVAKTRRTEPEEDEGEDEGQTIVAISKAKASAAKRRSPAPKRRAPAPRRRASAPRGAREGAEVEESGDEALGQEVVAPKLKATPAKRKSSVAARAANKKAKQEEERNEGEEALDKREAAPYGIPMREPDTLEPKHKVFLSHSGAQKNFVEQLCVDLERCDQYPFFDKRQDSLPIGKNFPNLIFEAIEQCEVGIVVLSEEFFTRSKWPMLELVAMTKNPKMTIIPVFLHISLEQVCDLKNKKKWLSVWRDWAQNDKKEVNLQDWCASLKVFGPVKALVYDGQGEVDFRKKIVSRICEIVLPQTRWSDFHVQGRSHLCKVICEKIMQATMSKKYGVRLVGLYGVGGIGKTTICQTLCNEYFTRMKGRVFHAEFERENYLDLLQGALRSLSDKSQEIFKKLNIRQCEDLLKKEMPKQAVFLAIDNVSDSMKSIEQAKTLLGAGFDRGSVVIVTARSLDILKLSHFNIDENNCLEMPELEEDEAKSLFLQHVGCDSLARNEVDDKIITNCVRRCYFQKLGDGRSYHYHPLALKVLGVQLGCYRYDPIKWTAQLKELDTFNLLRESEHPIFSILRKSFDDLSATDRLLFMDVALFLPEAYHKCNVFEWLSMVHRISVPDVMKGLEGLKRKSLIEDLGDGHSTRIGMHDLWREFSVIETTVGEFVCRRWVYEAGGPNAIEEGTPSGGCWHNMKRMCFLGHGLMSVERVNFDYFSNTTVMKLAHSCIRLPVPVLDVKNLKHLKSLELELGRDDQVEVFGLSSLRNLLFLKLGNIRLSAAGVVDIERLTNLQVLVLVHFQGGRLPDLSKLISLQEVNITGCTQVATITGFSSRLSRLKNFVLQQCDKLRSLGPDAEDLVALEELSVQSCDEIDELPALQMLTNLRKLDIHFCSRIESLKWLGVWAYSDVFQDPLGFRTLSQLEALRCTNMMLLREVPDLGNFPGLRWLNLSGCCKLMSLTSTGPLYALEELNLNGCQSLNSMSDLSNFQQLKFLYLGGCKSLMELNCTGALPALEELSLDGCCSLKAIPDLSNFLPLKKLYLKGCDKLMELTCSGPLPLLEELDFVGCPSPKSLPDLSNFQGLKKLHIRGFDKLMELTCIEPLGALEILDLGGCDGGCRSLKAVPDLCNFPRLKILQLSFGESLTELKCTEPLAALEKLDLNRCRSLKAMPNLSNFQRLNNLYLRDCSSLMELTCSHGPLAALEEINLGDCGTLNAMPDLTKFPHLKLLWLRGCVSLTELTGTGPLAALKELNLVGCSSLKSMPDLSNFQGLKKLSLGGCNKLMELICTEPLAALEKLDLGGCHSLKIVPDLSNFPRLNLKIFIPQQGMVDWFSIALKELKLGGSIGIKRADPDRALKEYTSAGDLLVAGESSSASQPDKVTSPNDREANKLQIFDVLPAVPS